MEREEHWYDWVLKEKVNEVVVADGVIRKTLNWVNQTIQNTLFFEAFINPANRRLNANDSLVFEEGGYAEGLLIGNRFYLLDSHPLVFSDTPGVRILSPHFADEAPTIAAAVALPEFRTVMYHSHPYLTERNLFPTLSREERQAARRIVQQTIRRRELSYLNEGRGPHDRNEVLNELFGRVLSDDDRKHAVGKHSMLVSATPGNPPLSHINFYRLGTSEDQLVRCRAATVKDVDELRLPLDKFFGRQKWARKIIWGYDPQTEKCPKELERQTQERLSEISRYYAQGRNSAHDLITLGFESRDPRLYIEALKRLGYDPKNPDLQVIFPAFRKPKEI